MFIPSNELEQVTGYSGQAIDDNAHEQEGLREQEGIRINKDEISTSDSESEISNIEVNI